MTDPEQGARLRATAAQCVDAVVTNGRSLDTALARLEGRVAARNRALLRLLSYGALRHHWRFRSWIEELVDRALKPRDAIINSLLAIGLYQLTETRIPDHAAVAQTVEAARLLGRPNLAPMVNAVLRRFLRDRFFERPPSNEEAACDHPQWLIDAFRHDWPDDWQSIIAANNGRAPMWLRVNAGTSTVAQYLQRLESADMQGERLAGLPQAVRLTEPQAVNGLPGFADGQVSVQDAAAQLAAPWLLTGIRGRVLDACAAPGGKSGHLLELGADRIDLTCIDIDAERLEQLRQNLDRLGLTATLELADASTPEQWWDGRPFAGILLDAPCTATGVIRRHPDIKVLRRATDVGPLAERQSALLDRLWPLLAPGGRLLYVTCSVLSAENDRVIRTFLERTRDAEENDALPNNNIRDLMRQKLSGFQVLPGTAALDGFYFACLQKAYR